MAELQLPGYRKLRVWQRAFELAMVGLSTDEDAERVNPLCNEVQRMLGSLIISLQKKRRAGDWDRSYGVKE